MNTFLPYADFKKSAEVLDNKRLGIQHVVCLQILNTLRLGPYQQLTSSGWIPCSEYEWNKVLSVRQKRHTPWYNHPAVKMWKGYERGLIVYGEYVCIEWTDRGFEDTCYDKIVAFREHFISSQVRPPWLGDEEFHRSHRSNLLRKATESRDKYYKLCNGNGSKYYRQYLEAEKVLEKYKQAFEPDLPLTLPYVWPVK